MFRMDQMCCNPKEKPKSSTSSGRGDRRFLAAYWKNKSNPPNVSTLHSGNEHSHQCCCYRVHVSLHVSPRCLGNIHLLFRVPLT